MTVYILTNQITKKSYVGSTGDVKGRMNTHQYSLKHHRKTVEQMQKDYDLYGWMTTTNHGGRRNATTTMRLMMTALRMTFPYSKNPPRCRKHEDGQQIVVQGDYITERITNL